jgi:hypothetical protein
MISILEATTIGNIAVWNRFSSSGLLFSVLFVGRSVFG